MKALRHFAILGVTTGIALLTACTEDDDQSIEITESLNLRFSSDSQVDQLKKVGDPFGIRVQGIGSEPETKLDSTFVVFTGVDHPVRVRPTSIEYEYISIESIPDSATNGPITVEIGDRKATSAFSLKFAPTIDSLKAYSIATGDTLLLKGFNLSTDVSKPRLSFFSSIHSGVQINYEVEAEILEHSPFSIIFVVPYRLANSEGPLILPIKMMLENSSGTDDFFDFEVVNPVLGYTLPKRIWPGAQCTIKALNVPRSGFLVNVLFGTTPSPKIAKQDVHREELHAQVPDLPLGKYSITVESEMTPNRPGIGVEIEIIERPTVEISSLSGSPGDTLTLSGADFRDRSGVARVTFYDGEWYSVCSEESNTCEEYFFDYSDSDVKFRVPEGLTDSATVELYFNSDTFDLGNFTTE